MAANRYLGSKECRASFLPFPARWILIPTPRGPIPLEAVYIGRRTFKRSGLVKRAEEYGVAIIECDFDLRAELLPVTVTTRAVVHHATVS